MTERIDFVEKRYVGHELVTPLEKFRAASSVTGVALSAATGGASASLSLLDVESSNLIMVRLLNIEVFNRQNNWITVEFRDGAVTAPRIAGPFNIPPQSPVNRTLDQLQGRGALSGLDMGVISGAVSQGVEVTVGFIPEQLDNRE